jgi:hypothetical protein
VAKADKYDSKRGGKGKMGEFGNMGSNYMCDICISKCTCIDNNHPNYSPTEMLDRSLQMGGQRMTGKNFGVKGGGDGKGNVNRMGTFSNAVVQGGQVVVNSSGNKGYGSSVQRFHQQNSSVSTHMSPTEQMEIVVSGMVAKELEIQLAPIRARLVESNNKVTALEEMQVNQAKAIKESVVAVDTMGKRITETDKTLTDMQLESLTVNSIIEKNGQTTMIMLQQLMAQNAATAALMTKMAEKVDANQNSNKRIRVGDANLFDVNGNGEIDMEAEERSPDVK